MKNEELAIKKRSCTKFYLKTFESLFYISMIYLVTVIISTNVNADSNKPGIVYDVVPSAQITKVSYYLNQFKGKETIHFDISIKNVSNSPLRFKVMVFIDDGPSGACYYPLTGKPPAIDPGKIYVEPMPIFYYGQLPNGFLIKIEEM